MRLFSNAREGEQQCSRVCEASLWICRHVSWHCVVKYKTASNLPFLIHSLFSKTAFLRQLFQAAVTFSNQHCVLHKLPYSASWFHHVLPIWPRSMGSKWGSYALSLPLFITQQQQWGKSLDISSSSSHLSMTQSAIVDVVATHDINDSLTSHSLPSRLDLSTTSPKSKHEPWDVKTATVCFRMKCICDTSSVSFIFVEIYYVYY